MKNNKKVVKDIRVSPKTKKKRTAYIYIQWTKDRDQIVGYLKESETPFVYPNIKTRLVMYLLTSVLNFKFHSL